MGGFFDLTHRFEGNLMLQRDIRPLRVIRDDYPSNGPWVKGLNQDFADISVIIPAYNRAELIGETLRSLLNQMVPRGGEKSRGGFRKQLKNRVAVEKK